MNDDQSLHRLAQPCSIKRYEISITSPLGTLSRVSYLAPRSLEELARVTPLNTEALVCLHQAPSCAESYRALGLDLNRRAPQVYMIALDIPGFGASDSLECNQPLSLDMLSDPFIDVLIKLAHLIKRPLHLCGHHTGAGLALAIASRAPELIASLSVIGLPALSLPMINQYRAYTEQLREQLKREQVIRQNSSSTTLYQDLESLLRAKDPKVSSAVIQREILSRLEAGTYLTDVYEAVWAYDYSLALRDLCAPLLLIAPRADPLSQQQSSLLKIVKDAGCTPWMIETSGGGYVLESATSEIAATLETWIFNRAQFAQFLCS